MATAEWSTDISASSGDAVYLSTVGYPWYVTVINYIQSIAPMCDSNNPRGYNVTVEVWARLDPSGTWRKIGLVSYVHISPIVSVGSWYWPGAQIGTTGSYAYYQDCWTGVHLQMDAYSYNHYSGWYDATWYGASVTDSSSYWSLTPIGVFGGTGGQGPDGHGGAWTGYYVTMQLHPGLLIAVGLGVAAFAVSCGTGAPSAPASRPPVVSPAAAASERPTQATEAFPDIALVDSSGRVLAVRSGKSVVAFEQCGRLPGAKEEYQSALSWSPDGKLLACATEDGAVMVSDLIQSRPLAGVGSCSGPPSWAADGSRLACRSVSGANVVTVGGSVTAVPDAVDIAWSPYAKVLAVRVRDGTRLLDPQGSGLARASGPVPLEQLRWATLSRRAAYASEGKVRLLDGETGLETAVASPWSRLLVVGWVLEDDAIVVQPVGVAVGPQLLRLKTLTWDPVPVPMPAEAQSVLPGGAKLAITVQNGSRREIISIDIRSGAAINVNGSDYNPLRPDGQRALTFAPDGLRLCWIESSAGARCAVQQAGTFRVVDVADGRPDTDESGEPLRAFSRNLQFVAAAAQVGQGTHLIAHAVGVTQSIDFGPVAGAAFFAWRP